MGGGLLVLLLLSNSSVSGFWLNIPSFLVHPLHPLFFFFFLLLFYFTSSRHAWEFLRAEREGVRISPAFQHHPRQGQCLSATEKPKRAPGSIWGLWVRQEGFPAHARGLSLLELSAVNSSSRLKTKTSLPFGEKCWVFRLICCPSLSYF